MAGIKEEGNFEDALKMSKGVVGYIYPVVIDKKTLEIVDGKHRKAADPGWPEIQIEFESKKDRLLYRIHANLIRRTVSRKERATQLRELALYLVEEGVPTEQIAQEIVKLVPELSLGYIMNLLPAKYKSKKKREAGAKGAKIRREKNKETTETLAPTPVVSEMPTAVVPKAVEVPTGPADSVRPKPKVVTPKVFTCPRCHIEVRTLYCSKCFSELSIRDVAKILRRLRE